jgi:hypothetical protein
VQGRGQRRPLARPVLVQPPAAANRSWVGGIIAGHGAPSATHHHTTHEPVLATIRYRFHPFCGEEVEIVRRLRRYTADSVVVKLRQSGLQIAVPSWMLDEAFCQPLVEGPHPRVAVAALLELGDLLASQPLLASSPKKRHE